MVRVCVCGVRMEASEENGNTTPRRLKPLHKINKPPLRNDNDEDDAALFDPLSTPSISKGGRSSSSNEEDFHNQEMKPQSQEKDNSRMYENLSEDGREKLRQELLDQCQKAADESRNGFAEDAEEGRKVFEKVYIQQKALLGTHTYIHTYIHANIHYFILTLAHS